MTVYDNRSCSLNLSTGGPSGSSTASSPLYAKNEASPVKESIIFSAISLYSSDIDFKALRV